MLQEPTLTRCLTSAALLTHPLPHPTPCPTESFLRVFKESVASDNERSCKMAASSLLALVHNCSKVSGESVIGVLWCVLIEVGHFVLADTGSTEEAPVIAALPHTTQLQG